MKTTILFRLAAIALAALLSGAAAAGEPYKLAVTDVEGLEKVQTEWGPFKAAVEPIRGPMNRA